MDVGGGSERCGEGLAGDVNGGVCSVARDGAAVSGPRWPGALCSPTARPTSEQTPPLHRPRSANITLTLSSSTTH